ncbi:MAG: sodium-translocating pyrophosphatase [Promethearchaeota archaeon]
MTIGPEIIAPITGVASIVLAYFTLKKVLEADPGNEKMQHVSELIAKGSETFIKRQYKTLFIFVGFLAVGIAVLFGASVGWASGISTAIAYVVGSVLSSLAGIIGMKISTKANTRAAQGATKSLNEGFRVAFKGGSVLGLLVVGFALTGITILYYIFDAAFPGDIDTVFEILVGYSFGASTIALFAKAGGGIFTKAADVGADIVGKVEQEIPEDDPRNPAAIADNVGDNVGDVAGMGADIFDSYVASMIAASVLGIAVDKLSGGGSFVYAMMPLFLAGLGNIASIVASFFVKVKEDQFPGKALNKGTYITTGVFTGLSFLTLLLTNGNWAVFIAAVIGLLSGVVIGITSDMFTKTEGSKFAPARKVAEAAQTGHATTILSGFSYGLLSVVPSIIGIAVAMGVSYFAGMTLDMTGLGTPASAIQSGLYSVAISAVGMLSITGMIVSSDAYGPIVDNARGIAEHGGLEEQVIATCDRMDEAGNTAKAITKGFSIGAAALTVIALVVAFLQLISSGLLDMGKTQAEVDAILQIQITNPVVMVGMLIGAMMPALFSAMLILGVDKTAQKMIVEIRRQFQENPGILEGTATADYDKCIDIATAGALKELLPSTIIAISTTIVVGLLLKPAGLAGYLVGSIIVGVLLALLMANAGGMWDNAKKYIEDGHFGGKGTLAHKASITGDTVGDPFKDTAGPALNTLLAVMSLCASLFAPVFLVFL